MYFLIAFAYTSTIECTGYVYGCEIWPMHLRSQGASISYFGFYLFSIIATAPASQAFATIGWKYYMVFICITIPLTIAIYFVLPEVSQAEQQAAFMIVSTANLSIRPRVLLSRVLVLSLATRSRSTSTLLFSTRVTTRRRTWLALRRSRWFMTLEWARARPRILETRRTTHAQVDSQKRKSHLGWRI